MTHWPKAESMGKDTDPESWGPHPGDVKSYGRTMAVKAKADFAGSGDEPTIDNCMRWLAISGEGDFMASVVHDEKELDDFLEAFVEAASGSEAPPAAALETAAENAGVDIGAEGNGFRGEA